MMVTRWLSSGELLGTGQKWRPTDTYKQLTLHIRHLFDRNKELKESHTDCVRRIAQLEKERTRLEEQLEMERMQCRDLQGRLNAMEVQLSLTPRPAPPPPPPPPPSSPPPPPPPPP